MGVQDQTSCWSVLEAIQLCQGMCSELMYPGSVGMMPITLCKAPISIESAGAQTNMLTKSHCDGNKGSAMHRVKHCNAMM